MILDKILVFGDDDSVSAIKSSNATADFYADMGTKKNHLYPLSHKSSSIGSNDYGEGGDLWFNALVTAKLTASSSATFTISLKTASSTSVASGTALLTHTTAALSSTSATTGADAGDYLIRAKVPAGVQRYLGAVYVASADKMKAGTISSWLSYGTATEI